MAMVGVIGQDEVGDVGDVRDRIKKRDHNIRAC